MESYSTTTNASDPEFSQTGSAANVNASLDSMESGAPSPADPVAAADAEETSPDPGAGAVSGMLSSPASVAVSAQPSVSSSNATNRVVKISGITEIGRDSKTSEIVSWKPAFDVPQGFEASFREIYERAESVRSPVDAAPTPTAATPYSSTSELFDRIEKAIAAQGCLSERDCRLLVYWIFSSWLPDAVSLAPGLAIFGPAYEGDLVLRTLRNLCRNPLMMTGITLADFKKINWRMPPTLLCYAPGLTKQMAAILGSASARGYLAGGAGNYLDFYCSHAVYLGDEVAVDRIPRCSIQVNILPTVATGASNRAPRLTEVEIQDLQNMLMKYRLKNLVRAYHSDFDAAGLTSDTRAVANALGAAIADAPELQSNLISLLTPVESQREADRSTGIEAVTVQAALNLCHAGKQELLAGEIAIEANRIQKARGERLTYSAEKVGHSLKKVGLYTRRLGSAGRGLLLDLGTMERLHELAETYGGVGLDRDEKNLHCHLCIGK